MKKHSSLRLVLITLIVTVLFNGCMPANQHRKDVSDDAGDRVTVGTVQQHIKVGMSSAEVIESLGSPNIVSTDEESREVWVYDKLSTEVVKSTSSGGTGLILSLVGGYKESTGAASKSQRTLTIIIKFDKNSKVRDISYHTSRF